MVARHCFCAWLVGLVVEREREMERVLCDEFGFRSKCRRRKMAWLVKKD